VKVATNWIRTAVRRMAWICLIFVVVMVPALWWLAHRPPTTSCDDRSWVNSSDTVVYSSQVVIKPWYGRHNVYGIFVIPPEYRDKAYSGSMIVRGVEEHEDLSARPTKEHGVIIAGVPDRYVRHAHLRSRIAWWFLLTGHFGDLRATCNWALVLTDKKPVANKPE